MRLYDRNGYTGSEQFAVDNFQYTSPSAQYSEERMDEIMREYEHRHQKGIIAGMIMCLLFICLMPVLAITDDERMLIPLVIIFAAFMIYMIKLGINKCPFCGHFIGRRRCMDKFCPVCGKQYRR